jgi:hypothetical protein
MKRLIKTVDLVFFEDDANGSFGLAHKDTFDDSNAFNAFWSGIGIFHDIFEHSHEKENKYFRGDYAMNVGGEMTAMGAMWYYFDCLGVSNRLEQGFRNPSDIMRDGTQSEIIDAIYSGYCRYGDTLLSNVPKQRPTYNSELEYQIEQLVKNAKKQDYEGSDEQEKEYAMSYRESVTFRKVADLHRYGYRMAERLVPDNYDNRVTLYTFIEFWETFCKKHEAKDLQNDFDGLTIKLYKDENGRISWKGVFTSRYPNEIKNATVTEDTKYFEREEYWIMEPENFN